MSNDAPMPDDLTLLGQIAGGDCGAFQTFYERHARRVSAYVRLLCRDRGQSWRGVDDVVQEVFIAVYKRASSYRPERGDPAGWLYAITRNKLVDGWRRAGKGAEVDSVDVGEMQIAVPAERGDIKVTVAQALSRLSQDQRQAVELAYFGGFTYEETAERLALPLGTLKSRIRTGLMNMRATIEGRVS